MVRGMVSQSLTVKQTQQQLNNLIGRTNRNRQSILITNDAGEALAWLSLLPEKRRDRQTVMFQAYLTTLDELLDILDEKESPSSVITLLIEHLQDFYQISREAHALFRQVILLTQLTVSNMNTNEPQSEQIATLRFGVSLLRRTAITVNDLQEYSQRLTENGLYPDIPFDEALLNHYIHES